MKVLLMPLGGVSELNCCTECNLAPPTCAILLCLGIWAAVEVEVGVPRCRSTKGSTLPGEVLKILRRAVHSVVFPTYCWLMHVHKR